MDSHLSSCDHAALATIQTKISSGMAALKAKAEDYSEGSQAQRGHGLDHPVEPPPSASDVNCKRNIPIAAARTGAVQVILDKEGGGVKEEVRGKANKPVVEIDNKVDALPLMKPDFIEAEDTIKEGTRLNDCPEKQPAAFPAPLTSSPPAEDGIAITGSSMEGIERRLSGGLPLESYCQKDGLSAGSRDSGPIWDASDSFESKAGHWGQGRMSSLNRADSDRDFDDSHAPPDLRVTHPVDAATVEQIQLEQALARGPAPGSQTEGGPAWTPEWPGRWQLLGLLGPRPRSVPATRKAQAPALKPVLSHRLPVLPRVQAQSPPTPPAPTPPAPTPPAPTPPAPTPPAPTPPAPTPRGTGPGAAAGSDDSDGSEAVVACSSCSESDTSTGANWT
jgi:hypothetical protein